MHGWQDNKRGACAQKVEGRAMAESGISSVIGGNRIALLIGTISYFMLY